MVGAFLLGLVLGGNLIWVFMSIARDRYWREFNARRRGSQGRNIQRGRNP